MLYTARGIGDIELVDEAGVPPSTASRAGYADFAVLRGDPSDGLPGVAGVGGEDGGRADQRVRRPRRHPGGGGADRRPEAAADGRGAKKMHAAAAYLDAAPVVVAVACDIDLPPIEGALPRRPADPYALAEPRRRVTASGPGSRRLGTALGWPRSPRRPGARVLGPRVGGAVRVGHR